jgi:anti-sigma factor RsiW
MRCRAVTRNLAAYLDNELSARKARKVQEHLARCPACKLRESELRQSWSLLNAFSTVEPPESLTRSIWTRIIGTQKLPKPYLARSPIAKYIKYALAAGVAVVILLYLATSPTTHEQPVLTELQTEVVSNMELLENLEILENPELMKDLDILLGYEDEDFESS